jgi:hypothetical protein
MENGFIFERLLKTRAMLGFRFDRRHTKPANAIPAQTRASDPDAASRGSHLCRSRVLGYGSTSIWSSLMISIWSLFRYSSRIPFTRSFLPTYSSSFSLGKNVSGRFDPNTNATDCR